MRRKRLQHVADTLCHMFCGWRQAFSKHALVALGDGLLKIDVLQGECTFEGRPIARLPIVEDLQVWMAQDLAANGIPQSAVLSVTLKASLSFAQIPWVQKTSTSDYLAHGVMISSGDLHTCEVRCESAVTTDERAYVGKHVDYEEWPVGWPAP